MADPGKDPQDRHQEVVVAYAWSSPTISISGEAQIERIRRHCREQKWQIAAELVARRRPDLGELARMVVQVGAERVVLTREASEELQCHVAGLWTDLQARFECREVAVVTI
jgi:hypothetical protein